MRVPEDRVRDLMHDADPSSERLGFDLVESVEVAEHKCVLRESFSFSDLRNGVPLACSVPGVAYSVVVHLQVAPHSPQISFEKRITFMMKRELNSF